METVSQKGWEILGKTMIQRVPGNGPRASWQSSPTNYLVYKIPELNNPMNGKIPKVI